MKKYDLCVIGGGPAGYAAAMRALDFNKKVLLIEKDKLGGAGIYNGALSSKTLWEISNRVVKINETKDASDSAYEISWEKVTKMVDKSVAYRHDQYYNQAQFLKAEAKNGRLLDLKYGFGSLETTNSVKIVCNDGTEEIIETKYIIIATGSKPRKLPNIKVDEEMILTSDGIQNLKEYPKKMVILGAGVIGCEFATIFSNLGKTKVFIIDRANRVLPFEDPDISRVVSENLQEKGVVVHNEAKFERMEVRDGKVEYEISYPQGMSQVIRVDKALLSVGRIPNTEGLGLEKVGIKISEKSRHVEDDDTRTSVKNIFVVGDASGHISLVNVGEIEARHAVEKMFSEKASKVSYDNICTIMFLNPEVAAVGMNEQNCIDKNIPIKVVKLDYSHIARAIAMGNTKGFFKIIVSNDDKMKILGMRAVGEHASSAIQAVGLLIKMNKGVKELAELVHPHPSIIEGVQECVRVLMNKPIFKAFSDDSSIEYYTLIDGVKKDVHFEMKD
jgi:dihydrolipoamide dehydrogenase